MTASIAPPSVRSLGHETCHHSIYSLRCADYEALLQRAGGRCELCGLAARLNYQGKLVVDHDAQRGGGYVRGLVCSKCNAHLRRVDSGERLYDLRTVRYLLNSFTGGPLRCDVIAWIAGDYATPHRRRRPSAGTVVRFPSAPLPDGCRWCGSPRRDHARQWVPSKRWHTWAPPTDAQRLARMRVRHTERVTQSRRAAPIEENAE